MTRPLRPVGFSPTSVALVLLLALPVLASFDPCDGLNCTMCANNTLCGYCKFNESAGNCTLLALLGPSAW